MSRDNTSCSLMKRRIGKLCMAFLMLGLMILFVASQGTKAEAAKSGSFKVVNQKVYYIYSDGTKATGLTKIGSKKYYFNSKGVQRNGWQKIGDDYYYFRIKNGKKGYMVVSDKVNGITLKSNGKAKVTSSNQDRLYCLMKAQLIVQSITKPTQKLGTKKKICWNYTLKYLYRGSPTFHYSKNWDASYAKEMFKARHGSCYHYGAVFAYLANACGYTSAKAVSSGGHGWAEVCGKVYDPSWEQVDKDHSYYGVDMSLSGVAGRPNYKASRKYVKSI